MPSSKKYVRDYKKEYANYQGTEEQKKNRAKRNTARRKYEAENGDLPLSKDVDHKKPLIKGGSNGKSNLRVQSKSNNRSFKRTKKAGMA